MRGLIYLSCEDIEVFIVNCVWKWIGCAICHDHMNLVCSRRINENLLGVEDLDAPKSIVHIDHVIFMVGGESRCFNLEHECVWNRRNRCEIVFVGQVVPVHLLGQVTSHRVIIVDVVSLGFANVVNLIASWINEEINWLVLKMVGVVDHFALLSHGSDVLKWHYLARPELSICVSKSRQLRHIFG